MVAKYSEMPLLFPSDEEINNALLKNNIHFLTGDIEQSNTLDAIKWITYENLLPGDNTLIMFINSDGGNLQDAFALIEVMRYSRKPIRTIGLGSICSSAFLIFAAGTKGERYITRTASIMCHQFTAGYNGKYHDIKAAAKENELINQRMLFLLKECTNLDMRTIKSKLLSPSDVWFTAEDIVELGIADNIF
jgi:ATP-dependent Clp endopeptidase proteolytic subunit ClpP